MSNTGTPEPNWYPDPEGRHEYRWFDGYQWTDQVSSHGKQATAPLTGQSHVPQSDINQSRHQKSLGRAGVQAGAVQGGGTLFSEPVLVVSQKAKLFEINSEYAISDQHGNQIGAVRQVGQSKAKKVMRALVKVDQFMTHKLQIVDHTGQVVLQLTKPAAMLKAKIHILDGAGNEIGSVLQENMIGKIRFGLEAGGQRYGSINAENWRAWNFSIKDAAETEVARITKTWQGFARAAFTSADNYVVQVHAPLQEPLRSIVVAAGVCVDTALSQTQA